MPVTSPRASVGLRGLTVPQYDPDNSNWLRQLARVLQGVMDGKINTVGEVTFTASVTTTTLTDVRIGPSSVVVLSPTTANAAAETPYIVPGDGSAVITHANAGTTDRTFKYAILG